jgi:glycosyltransferase involved in cell wall biosynthesis
LKASTNPSQKTVLVFSDSHSFCGVGQYAAALMMVLRHAGYRTICAQRRESTPLQAKLSAAGVEFLWFGYDPDRHWKRFINDQELPRQIYASASPDLIVFANGNPTGTASAMVVARKIKIPYIIWEGHVRLDLFPDSGSEFDCVRDNYQGASAAICVSRQNLDVIRTHFAFPDAFGSLIHTFAGSDYFTPRDPHQRTQLRSKWGVPENGIVCFTSAKMESVKGYDVQINAIERLKQTVVWGRLHFVWAGDGSIRGAVSAHLGQMGVKERVRLLGHVWNLPELLDAADIFVLPSRAEGMPLTILEAMAKGLPVIATDVGGNSEALENCGEVISAPYDNAVTAAELAEKIEIWTNNPAIRIEKGRAARARAIDLFDEAKIMAQTLSLIDNALA